MAGPQPRRIWSSLGAEHVIDYTRADITDGNPGHDVILDLAGNRSLSHLRRALAPRGTLVIVGGERDGRWLVGPTQGHARGKVVITV